MNAPYESDSFIILVWTCYNLKLVTSEQSGDFGSGPQGQNLVQVGSEWSSGSRIRVGFEWVYLATLLYSYLNPVLHQYFIITCFSLLVEKLRGTVKFHAFLFTFGTSENTFRD